MSYTSGFFDAIDLGGGNYDRVYSASAFAHYFSLLVGNGVFANPTSSLQVMAQEDSNMEVLVLPGTGWINGYYLTVENDTSEILSVPIANPTLPRIDSVVIGWNNSNRQITPYIKPGTPSISPSPSELQRDKEIYELELAQISVPAGLGAVTQEQIKDMRQDAERCGIVSGLIDQFDATGLFAQYETIFKNWFDKLEYTLSGDVAGNLQIQIDNLQHITSKGTARVSDWSGNPPYTCRVSVPGMNTDQFCDAFVAPVLPMDNTEFRSMVRKAIISPIAQEEGFITLLADGGKPNQDIPIVAMIFNKKGEG